MIKGGALLHNSTPEPVAAAPRISPGGAGANTLPHEMTVAWLVAT
jgi:hypothetical protein